MEVVSISKSLGRRSHRAVNHGYSCAA